jgi:hypothetical protein
MHAYASPHFPVHAILHSASQFCFNFTDACSMALTMEIYPIDALAIQYAGHADIRPQKTASPVTLACASIHSDFFLTVCVSMPVLITIT